MNRNFEPLWRIKAKEEGRLRGTADIVKQGAGRVNSQTEAARSWSYITKELTESDRAEDKKLARRVAAFLRESPFAKQLHIEAERNVQNEHSERGI